MEFSDFLRSIKAAIAEEIREREVSLGMGVCSDFPVYRENVGEITGLHMASQIVDDRLKQLHEEDDDD
jgi:hypothetical protein